MKILSNYSQYRQALKEIDPYRIAIAYIGLDYSAYINTKKIREFIVSPTVGSNPHAISSIIKEIDIANVNFIDQLHSKLFIGKKGAIIGSANLSRNALEERGLLELGVLLNSATELAQLNHLFDEYQKIAKKLYPNAPLKESRIAKLYDAHNKMSRSLNSRVSGSPQKSFGDYLWGIDEPFKLSWYDILEPDNKAYVKKNFYKEFPGVTWEDISKNIKCDIEIPRNDKLEEDEWLLTFQLNKQYLCMKAGLEWMYIDKKITNAYTKKYYPTGCFELANVKHPLPPFIIDKKFRNLFAEVVNQDKYKTVRKSMYIKNIKAHIPQIIKEIKIRY